LSGSIGNSDVTKSFSKNTLIKRNELINLGQILVKDSIIEFVEDMIFKTPSAASDMVLGRSSNGWTEWKDKNGKTLDEKMRK
jgi:hypothetical protein